MPFVELQRRSGLKEWELEAVLAELARAGFARLLRTPGERLEREPSVRLSSSPSEVRRSPALLCRLPLRRRPAASGLEGCDGWSPARERGLPTPAARGPLIEERDARPVGAVMRLIAGRARATLALRRLPG
jgi:hypothetical protein